MKFVFFGEKNWEIRKEVMLSRVLNVKEFF